MDMNFLSEGLNKLFDKLEGWGTGLIKMLPNLIIAIFVVLIFYGLSKWGYKLTRRILKKTYFNESLEHLLSSTCGILIFIIGIILALAVLDLQKTVFSMLAGVGVIGLALGFAFQDLAANFMSGIMLAVRSPLNIGDIIEINGTTGKVIKVRLRETLIRNFNGQNIYIPNKDFTTNELINYSKFGKRRIEIEVGIGYEDDPQQGVKIVKSALEKVDGILSNPQPEVYVNNLGASSVNIIAYGWISFPKTNFFKAKSEATIAVKTELENSNFNIPFPIRTIKIPENANLNPLKS